MGASFSSEKDEDDIDDLKEVIRSMKWRLSRLEADNAMMNKTITNLKVSSNTIGRSVAKIHERVFNMPVDMDKSVRVPKMSRSLYAK